MDICVVLLECLLALSGVNCAKGTRVFCAPVKRLQLLIGAVSVCCFRFLWQASASVFLHSLEPLEPVLLGSTAILSAKEMLSLQLSLFCPVGALMLS